MISLQSHISSRCSQKLPGYESHKKMQPHIRQQFQKQKHHIESAVLICIFEKNNIFHTIYTKRAIQLHDKHSGQISFPGGRFENSDKDFSSTALRECYEEIGLRVSQKDICGKLSELYVPVSNFNIHPYIAYLQKAPELYKMQISEDSEIIEISLQTLVKPESQDTKTINRNGVLIQAPFYQFENYHIWGATAMITAELLDVLFS